MRYVWVAYDRKPPNLPVAVADSATELARILGTTEHCIYSTWSKFRHGRFKTSRFHKVVIEGKG